MTPSPVVGLGLGLSLGLALWSGPWLPVAAQPVRGELVRCVVTTSTATTIQVIPSPCAATTDGNGLYLTDILFSASATGIGADAFPTLKYGTGTTCGPGTTIIWGALTAAAFVTPHALVSPIRVPPGTDLCWISSTAGSKFLVLVGFRAP